MSPPKLTEYLTLNVTKSYDSLCGFIRRNWESRTKAKKSKLFILAGVFWVHARSTKRRGIASVVLKYDPGSSVKP